MRQPFRGGKSLRVLALLTFLVPQLSSFGVPPPPTVNIPPPLIKGENPGFLMGVDESDATMFSSDVTGAPVINPYADSRGAFSKVQARGREYARVGDSTSVGTSTTVNLRPLFGLDDQFSQFVQNFHQPRPTNAVLQAGPFFVQFHDITAGLLISDNVNFVPHNAEWGAIAELRLRLSGILQISPTWRLVVSGSIIYLPFENEFGVEGFGIGDAMGFIAEETFQPITRMQLAYNSQWAGWDVQFVDDFRVRYVNVTGAYNPFVRGVVQPEGIHAEDVEGRYVFGNGTTIAQQNLDHRQNDSLDINTFIELENRIVGSASRLLPTETRFTLGASHSDVWSEGDWGGGTNALTPTDYSVDRVFASLVNERESMRFKPFLYYDAYRYNYDPDWTHQIAIGFSGPITENMFIHAEGGYVWGSVLLKDTWFYRFILDHTVGPYTRQFAEYSRNVTEPVREIRDRYRYGLHQALGPKCWGRLYIERSIYQPEQGGVYASVEDRLASRIVWEPVPRHTILIGGAYSENRFENATRDQETTWEARAEIRYRYRPNLAFSFLYRYLNINTRQSLLQSDSAENLWVITVQKYF